MALSNATIAGGVFGLASGALLGAIIGKNLSEGAPNSESSPMPEAFGLLGAIAGGVLFAAVANNLATAGTTTTTTSSNTVSNGITTLPPPGA